MATPPLTARILELLTLFNRQKTDLPDGLLHADCVFRLNGLAYHEHLGRPPDDPLVRLVGCGPAGYRFLLAAVRHAILEPRVALEQDTVQESGDGAARTLAARATLTGTLRGHPEASPTTCEITVHTGDDGTVRELSVLMGDADVERLLTARKRP